MNKLPLGIRNNNPLNIRRVNGTHWQGEILPLKGAGGSAFVQFSSIEYGLRAAFCLLRTYRDKYHAVCIRDIITRWAPPSENDTEKYIYDLCKLTGFGGNERLTENEWPRLVQAMALIESGINLSSELIAKGYRLYRGNEKNERMKK